MKKIISFLIVAFTILSVSTFAQDQKGNSKEMIKQELKDSLHLSGDKADSAASIIKEYNLKRRELFKEQSKSTEDKRAAMQTMNAERNQRLKNFLTNEQLSKLEAMERNRRAQMRNRGSGNN
jgi:hypothetical protein